jgi:tight adherence protein C
MSGALTGAAIGLVGASGVLVTIAHSPPMRRPRLVDRLAPYLRDTTRPSRLLDEQRTVTPFPALDRLLGPPLRDLARHLDRTLGGTASVRRRLEQAGRRMSVEQFRLEQVLWAAAGLAAGLGVAGLAVLRNGAGNPVLFLALGMVCALTGVVLRDRGLTVEVQRRERLMLAEFPTVAELLALAVAAGEGAVGALERITRLSDGALARELGAALAEARTGTSLVVALERMAARTSLPALARFVDGMAIAVERGTPLAEVLRAQAVDVREQGRRQLMETAGRKEIAMLVPVVFLVLPVTVVFALFPGFYHLSLTVP